MIVRLLLASMVLALAGAAFASDDDDEGSQDSPLSRKDVAGIQARSLQLLRNVDPSRSATLSFFPRRMPLRQMDDDKGTVYWGTLFKDGEIAALTDLAPKKTSEPYDYPPEYACFFVWKDHRWVFRQFLGNATGLELHYRKDHPSAFLQATRQTGRYQGDYFSWYYDEKTGLLVPTNFEDWGPFYLVGNYLCLARGYERLAHDDTHWIYDYKNGRKGALVACLHENDRGPFDIEFRDPKSGEMVTWSFVLEEGENNASVSIAAGDDPSKILGQGEISGADISPEYFFELLTGFSPKILDEEWHDELPAREPLQRVPIHATGAP